MRQRIVCFYSIIVLVLLSNSTNEDEYRPILRTTAIY